MVGLDIFQKTFKNFKDCYTIIGGAACDILMSEKDMPFRATKDIDIILILEDNRDDFATTFWSFIKAGCYKCGWKNNDNMHFYRFTEPSPGFPVQIELFSRKQNYNLKLDNGIIPIHISDDTSSLSAILLNDDYYNFMIDGRKDIHGLSVLDAAYLIPFKMYAWLDLTEKKLKGEKVDSRNIKKHKNDVFRLLEIVPMGTKINLQNLVYEKTKEFLIKIEKEPFDLQQLNSSFSFTEAIKILKNIYLF